MKKIVCTLLFLLPFSMVNAQEWVVNNIQIRTDFIPRDSTKNRLEWICNNIEDMALRFAEKKRCNIRLGFKVRIHWHYSAERMRSKLGRPYTSMNGGELVGYYDGQTAHIGRPGDWSKVWHELGHHYFGGQIFENLVTDWEEWAYDEERKMINRK